ncbi:MAG: MCP four helix bundle domain-containing protein [Desulfobulbaceae bacterium]|nr:MCP four helix bundle domain-containing protein [Desulfobulbaceae bacterium]
MKLKFSTKTLFWLTGVIIIAMTTSIVALMFAWKMRHTLDDYVLKDAKEMLYAAELDIALQRQRNYLMLHMLTTNDQQWIKELENLEPVSKDILVHFHQNIEREKESDTHLSLHRAFTRYNSLRNKIIELYKSGNQVGARQLAINDLTTLYTACTEKCDELVQQKKHDIVEALQWSESESQYFSILVGVSIFLTFSLGLGLVWMLFHKIFFPLKKMAREIKDFPLFEKHAAGQGNTHQDDLDTLVRGLKMFMTEVSETRSDLENSKHELLQANHLAAIGNTVAQIAHEIKNRLVVLGGLARSISKRADDAEETRKKADIIFQEVDKLENMLKQITDFSKPIRLQTKVCSLNALLNAVMAKFDNITPKNINLITSFDSNLPHVSIDVERMEQVIINLVRNAIEAMETEGCVTVKTTPHVEKGVALIIKDEGPGMSEEVRTRIFEPFFTTKKEGTGLGLAISRKIVQDHGAEMQCDSQPDKGTTFTLVFPAA